MKINSGLLSTLNQYQLDIPLALEALLQLKSNYDPGSYKGICWNWCNILCTEVPFEDALNISHDIIFEYTGEAYPIEGYSEHSRSRTLWKGEQLEQRLKLIDEIIDVLEAYIGGNYEV